MIHLTQPENGATIPLLRPEHRAYLQGGFSPDGAHDLDTPLPCEFTWEGAENATLCLRDESGASVSVPARGGNASVSFLKAGTRYEWTVSGAEEVFSFQTEDAYPRWIAVPGIANCRDIGGWPTQSGARVKQGLLYRSSELNSHEHLTAQGAHLLQTYLGIKTEIDMRGVFERCWPGMDTARVNWKNYKVVAYGDMFRGASRANAVRLFHLLADRATYPAIFHCWGGMDRTGTVAFLVNGILGVGRDDLICDYCASSFSHGGLRTPEYHEFPAMLREIDSLPGTMEEKCREYLLRGGVPREDLDSIRSIFCD